MRPGEERGPGRKTQGLDEQHREPESSTADVPGLVADVQRYRRAARRLVGGPGDFSAKLIAIAALADQARKSCALPRWGQTAIWLETRHYIETGEIREAGPSSSDPVINTLRSLRARQLTSCPTCRRPIPPAAVLDGWADAVFRSSVEHAISERAVAA